MWWQKMPRGCVKQNDALILRVDGDNLRLVDRCEFGPIARPADSEKNLVDHGLIPEAEL